MPNYREVVIFNIISLVRLDGQTVTAEQKVNPCLSPALFHIFL